MSKRGVEGRSAWVALVQVMAVACGSTGGAAAGSGGSGATAGTSGSAGAMAGAGNGAGGTAGSTNPGSGGGGAMGGAGATTLAAEHPGDVGLGNDSSVIWFEDFEEGSLGAIAARYDQVRDNGRWQLVSDTPNGTGSALALRAGQGEDAVDLYKQLPDGEDWYVRWYARYQRGIPWHHSGMWFGGYNPAQAWPSPNAGYRPNGDDRFSIAVEPVFGTGGTAPRFDYYNYWMTMHSWEAPPIVDDGTAYYGNALVHQNGFTLDEESWVCLEVHTRLNSDVTSGAGAVLEVWKNDQLLQRFDDASPMGYWIRDKFCPEGADGSECTDYPAPFDQILDLQFRSTTDLKLNAFWPQNYITDNAQGTLTFDQMVVATRRVGCMR